MVIIPLKTLYKTTSQLCFGSCVAWDQHAVAGDGCCGTLVSPMIFDVTGVRGPFVGKVGEELSHVTDYGYHYGQ